MYRNVTELPGGSRRGATLIEVMVAASISAMVLSGVVSLLYISGHAIKDLYATTESRSERATAMNHIRFRLSDAKQGTCVVSNGGRTIQFHDPNMGVGVVSQLRFETDTRTLYYMRDVSNPNGEMVVAKGPIDITFTLGSRQLDPPDYTAWNGQDGVVTTYVQTSSELTYARVDMRDGESIVALRNTTDSP